MICIIVDKSIALNKYDETLDALRNWQPPIKLTFRKVPEKKGYLIKESFKDKGVWKPRYAVLAEGKLYWYENEAMKTAPERLSLVGLSVSLLDASVTGRENCFMVLYGYDKIILQAETTEIMYDWACALYYGMALCNGGGYLLSAMDKSKLNTGDSVDIVDSTCCAPASSSHQES
jgi:hypothetical protein